MLKTGVKSVPISKAKASESKEVVIKGWIYRKRSSGGKIFAVVRDRTGIIQCIIDKSAMSESAWNAIDSAYLESSIIIKGTVKKDERAPDGVEMEAKDVLVVHSGEQFPITEYQSPEFLLDVRHLWLRSQRMIMAMKARSYIFRYARDFLDKQGFFEITPPLVTVAGGETGADLFEVKYFDQKAYLTESSQLYSEAMIYSLEKVYSFAPSYRAEKSRTVKHLAEYWHLEPEMAYFNNAMNMKFQEKLVSGIANKLAKEHPDILKFFSVEPDSLIKIRPPFKRLSYDQAIALLQEKGSDKKWGDDFGVEEEKLLTENEDKPIFVYNWPKEIKAFYMPVNPKDERTVLCADMLAPHGHGEIIGGSEREWRYEELVKRMKELNMNLDNYSWYIDLRKYGSVPHAGFGLGIERVIKWMLNLDHIRDAIPFPRVINRLTP
ncbi:MAG: asparagine--tRNA ligase [Candidatus Marsarchaeota archaeon]|nr:asparagine--tRNA ligase [Candidatus Marsarchaeota archaeon]